MIRKFCTFCIVIMCTMATMPLTHLTSHDNERAAVHTVAKSIMERKLKQYEYRLPSNTIPRVYIIHLEPNFFGEKFTFNGNGTIYFEVLRPTISVTLHRSDKMDIEKPATELVDERGDVKKPISQRWNSANNFYSIKFDTQLNIGNYSLKMSWTGRDGADDWYSPLTGFYRAIDKDQNNNPKYLITTHFEPIGARWVFPCWDEPGLKAQFEFSITHYPNYTALSNMPSISHEELSDGKVLTKFQRSPLMSSYLPCLVVADYKCVKNIHGNITFYTLESALDSVKYALEISEKVISAMEFYTGVPYALPKLDQITIPQYSAMAMEHWGLVSYVTSSVIRYNTTILPDIFEQERVEIIVAHELAHQWFGNLVTPVWWNDAWLNEAFADYFQYKVLEIIFPEQKIMDYFVVEHTNGLSFPAEEDSQVAKPIKWNPMTKIQIDRMFSQITYAKGSGVLHMLDHILGEEIFRDGIRRYMKAHQFASVVTDDLWNNLQLAYDEKNKDKPLNIKETMDPWIEQTGHPTVTVTRNYETGDVILTQQNTMANNPNNKWRIPINYATKSNPDFSSTLPTMWFNKNEENVTITNIMKDDWIILNIQQRGFYIVDYDKENWRRIADYLNSDNYTKISPINRAQLITDSFQMIPMDFISENMIRLEIFINITSYLHREIDYIPWIPAAKAITEFSEFILNTPLEDLFKTYMHFLMHEILHYQSGNNYTDEKVKLLLMPFACKFEHIECQNISESSINNYLEDPTRPEFNTYHNKWITCAALQNSNETVWDSFIKSVNNTDYAMIPYRLLKCSKSKEIRDKYMNQMLTINVTEDLSDIISVFREFNTHKKNVDYILNYFIDNFELIEQFFEEKHDPEYVAVIIAILNVAIKTQDQYEKFKNFLEPRIEAYKDKFDEPELDKIPKDLEDVVQMIETQTAEIHALVNQRLLEINTIKINKKN